MAICSLDMLVRLNQRHVSMRMARSSFWCVMNTSRPNAALTAIYAVIPMCIFFISTSKRSMLALRWGSWIEQSAKNWFITFPSHIWAISFALPYSINTAESISISTSFHWEVSIPSSTRWLWNRARLSMLLYSLSRSITWHWNSRWIFNWNRWTISCMPCVGIVWDRWHWLKHWNTSVKRVNCMFVHRRDVNRLSYNLRLFSIRLPIKYDGETCDGDQWRLSFSLCF